LKEGLLISEEFETTFDTTVIQHSVIRR